MICAKDIKSMERLEQFNERFECTFLKLFRARKKSHTYEMSKKEEWDERKRSEREKRFWEKAIKKRINSEKNVLLFNFESSHTKRLFVFSRSIQRQCEQKGELQQNQLHLNRIRSTLAFACAAIHAQRLAAIIIIVDGKWIMVEWSKKQRHAYQICTIHTTFKLKRFCFFSFFFFALRSLPLELKCTYTNHIRTRSCVCIEIEKLLPKNGLHELFPSSSASAVLPLFT